MLVLTRKVNEEIVINGEIRIQVVRVEGNKVRIGIVAPPEMRIVRGELTTNQPDEKPLVECR